MVYSELQSSLPHSHGHSALVAPTTTAADFSLLSFYLLASAEKQRLLLAPVISDRLRRTNKGGKERENERKSAAAETDSAVSQLQLQHKFHLRWQTPTTAAAAVHTICRWCPCHSLTDCVCLQKLENTIEASKHTAEARHDTARRWWEQQRTGSLQKIKKGRERQTKRAKQIRDNTHTEDMRNRWGGWRRRRQQNSACTTFSVRKKEDQKQSETDKQSEKLNLKLNRSLSQANADTLSLQVANLVDCSLKEQHPQHCSVFSASDHLQYLHSTLLLLGDSQIAVLQPPKLHQF